MSDVSLNIMDRTYRLAVAPENEEKLRRCGRELDGRMRRIRESGRVLGYDQIAVMVALDLLWASFDRDERAQRDASRIEELVRAVEAAIERLEAVPEAPVTPEAPVAIASATPAAPEATEPLAAPEAAETPAAEPAALSQEAAGTPA